MKKIFIITTLCSILFSSCLNRIERPTSNFQYKENFEQAFGEIPQTQNWDFFSLYFDDIVRNKADGTKVIIRDTIQPTNLIGLKDWATLLPDGKNNTNTGIGDVNLLANGPFKCYAVWYSSLNVVDPNRKFEIGIKVDGIEYPLFKDYDYKNNPVNTEEVDKWMNDKPIGFNPRFAKEIDLPKGEEFEFYLKHTTIDKTKGSYLGADHMKLFYNEIAEGKQRIILGFEDTPLYKSSSDKDFNDIILYLEGNPELPMAACKRFMCEDTGTSGDFDFNDVVFDIQILNTQQCKITIQAIGGTIPIHIYISDKYIGEAHNLMGVETTQMVNTFNMTGNSYSTIIDLDKTIILKDFTDIKIYVGDDKPVHIYGFPIIGSAPFVFAVPVSVMWSKEMVRIDSTYPKFFQDNWYK